MRNKFSPALLAVICILLANTALADSTSENLTRIEAETLVLKAREKQLAVQAQIAEREAEIARKQAANLRLPGGLPGIANDGDPGVRSIEGIGKAVFATLQLDNGSTMEAKVGDTLPNGMRVVSISANEVIVETRKKRRVRLSTGTAAAMPQGTAYSNNSAGMPPLPPPGPFSSGFAR